jgi:hypothetical protein
MADGHAKDPDELDLRPMEPKAPMLLREGMAEREQDRSKDVGAARWIAAVNHWARLGRWRCVKIHSPYQLTPALAPD